MKHEEYVKLNQDLIFSQVLQKASYMSNRCFKMTSVFSDGLMRVQIQRWERPIITGRENVLAEKF